MTLVFPPSKLSFLLQIRYIKSTSAPTQIVINSGAWELKFQEVGEMNLPAHISSLIPPCVPPSVLVCLKPAVVLLLLEGKHSTVNVYHLVQTAYKVFIADGAGAMWSVGEVVLPASKLFGSVLPAGLRCCLGVRAMGYFSGEECKHFLVDKPAWCEDDVMVLVC